LATRFRFQILVVAALAFPCRVVTAQEIEDTRPVIRGITFVGNESIDDRLLRISIRNTQSSAFQRHWYLRWMPFGEPRYLDERQLRTDLLRVQALYFQSGFFEAVVDTIVDRSNGDVRITFVIDEGRPVVLTELTVLGVDSLLDVDELERTLPLQVGDPFNRRLFQASIDSILLQLGNVGHPFAEVFTNFREDRPNRVATVTLDVDPSIPVRIGEIEVIGADEILPDVVRGLISIEPGQVFDERRLYDSQILLFRLGVYNRASLSLVDSLPPDDSLVTVRARLSEGELRRLRLGAGYGTTDCFRALGQWTLNNFGGSGRRLSLSSRVSRIGVGGPLNLQERLICRPLRNDKDSLLTLNYNLIANIYQPAFLSRRTSGTFSVFAERVSEFQAYRRDAIGGEVVITQQVAINIPISIAYSLARGRTIADPATQCQFLNQCVATDTVFNSPRTTSKITLTMVREDRNSILDPTRGSFWSAQLSLASPLIGSDSLSTFLKGIVEYASYQQVGRDRTLSWRVRAGALWAPEVVIDGVTSRYAPPEERFYAGGATTVRGLAQNELGPIVYVADTTTVPGDTLFRASPIGGNGMLLGNLEYRLPVGGPTSSLMAAVFLDAGAVFNFDAFGTTSPSRFLDTYRITPGVGMRIGSPLGPVRFDVALNVFSPQPGQLYFEEGDELTPVPPPGDRFQPEKGFLGPFRIHISIGQAF